MSELESLALLIADLHTQVHGLQQENAVLHQENVALRDELSAERERAAAREDDQL